MNHSCCALRVVLRLFAVVLPAFLLLSCGKPAASDGRKVTMYRSPMHPWITSDKPGQCTICGMDLVPVYEGEAGKATDPGLVTLSEASATTLGVATVPVRRMDLTKALRFTGTLEDDENIHRVIAGFYDGRIDQVYVNHVGQYLEKGQPMAAIYSPDLLYVVREYQNASSGGDAAVARNAARRLVQYGLSVEQVAGLAKAPQEVFAIDILAPISGTVVTKKAYKGQYIKTGEPLFEMGDLTRLWFHAEVYERDLPDIKLGQKAILRSPSVPGREFPGVVTFIDPNFDPRTRSTKVRIEVDNPAADPGGLRRLLPHRAYAEASINADLGGRLVVPRSAILRDGRRAVAYVETAPGAYQARAVEVGRIGDEGIEVLAGLTEAERVVVEGNLMIDAEAQLRSSASVTQAPPPAALAAAPAAATEFLAQVAAVSEALATDDTVAAVATGRRLAPLAQGLAATGNESVDHAIHAVQAVNAGPAGGDLAAIRRSFLPWSEAGSALALALRKSGQDPGVRVLACPMTSDSFPGAPGQARWVQRGEPTRNPYFGARMLDCGAEVKE